MAERVKAILSGLYNPGHKSVVNPTLEGGIPFSIFEALNVTLRNGIIEGREGFEVISELPNVENCYGLGYAEYGNDREFIAVLAVGGVAKPYVITPDGNFTAIDVAVHASDWEFVQYEKWIFALNREMGVRWKRIGYIEWLSDSTIPQPSNNPNLSVLQTTPSVVDFTGATVTISGHTGMTITVENGIYLKISTGTTAITSPVTITITAEFTTTKDFTYRDVHFTSCASYNDAEISFQGHRYWIINNDTSPVTIEPVVSAVLQAQDNLVQKIFHFLDSARPFGGTNLRDNIKKVEFEFEVISAAASTHIAYMSLYAGDVWLCDTESLQPLSPVRNTIEYCYSYYDVSEALEGPISDTSTSPIVPRLGGNYIEVVGGTTTSGGLTATDKLYFYRKEKATGIWRKIGEALNTGTPLVNDTFMEHEIGYMTARSGPNIDINAKYSAITVWKGCLVLCENDPSKARVGVAYISFVGQPFKFMRLNGDNQVEFDSVSEESLDRGRTLYVPANRGSEIMAAIGLDSLYFVTRDAVYVMVGDLPSDMTSPRKLPGSRGSVSHRGVCPYSGGILVPSEDGLWFYRIERNISGDVGSLTEKEITAAVRNSWRRLRMNMEETEIDDDSLFVTTFYDEIWCINKRRYLRFNREGQWEEGVYPYEIEHAAITHRYGFMMMFSQSGKFIRNLKSLSEEEYRTDAGEPIEWKMKTGFIDTDRIQINSMEIQGDGPISITAFALDGSKSIQKRTYDQVNGEHVFMLPSSVPPGRRFEFEISGKKTENSDPNVQSIWFYVEKAGEGLGR